MIEAIRSALVGCGVDAMADRSRPITDTPFMYTWEKGLDEDGNPEEIIVRRVQITCWTLHDVWYLRWATVDTGLDEDGWELGAIRWNCSLDHFLGEAGDSLMAQAEE